MLDIEKSVADLEALEAKFDEATTGLTEIMREQGYLTDTQVPDNAVQTSKYAASAGILSDIETVMQEAANPSNVRIAVQLAKIGDKARICFPGGALLSEQELTWMESHQDQDAPGHLFYILAQDQLVEKGELNFSYDFSTASPSFSAKLRSDLLRELGEEAGEEAASKITLKEFLPGERVTTLSAIGLPDSEVSKEIATKLASRGVTLNDKGRLQGVYTNVTEKVAVATGGDLSEIERLATDNEKETKGMRVKSLGELAIISLQTSESVDAFDNFKNLHGDPHGTDGMRNPSATWGLSLVTAWLKEQVKKQDTYKDGSPRS